MVKATQKSCVKVIFSANHTLLTRLLIKLDKSTMSNLATGSVVCSNYHRRTPLCEIAKIQMAAPGVINSAAICKLTI
jgi:hypothetical protein